MTEVRAVQTVAVGRERDMLDDEAAETVLSKASSSFEKEDDGTVFGGTGGRVQSGTWMETST